MATYRAPEWWATRAANRESQRVGRGTGQPPSMGWNLLHRTVGAYPMSWSPGRGDQDRSAVTRWMPVRWPGGRRQGCVATVRAAIPGAGFRPGGPIAAPVDRCCSRRSLRRNTFEPSVPTGAAPWRRRGDNRIDVGLLGDVTCHRNVLRLGQRVPIELFPVSTVDSDVKFQPRSCRSTWLLHRRFRVDMADPGRTDCWSVRGQIFVELHNRSPQHRWCTSRGARSHEHPGPGIRASGHQRDARVVVALAGSG